MYDRLRHRSAHEAADAQPTARSFDPLRGHKHCLLVTYRRDGTAVPTPMWFGMVDGKVYARTAAGDWKVKRIHNDPRVRLAPCTFRGRVRGPVAEGRARVVGPEEEPVAEAALESNYGLGRRMYRLTLDRARTGSVYIEISPDQERG